jgi:hypothetical protein
MLLNDLASLARGAGLTVQEAPNWVGHNHGSMTSVSCIVIHHTAGSATGDYPSYNVVRNGRTGLPGPLAQLGVGRSGKVYVFSNGLAYHAGTVKETWMNNANSIGIEVESVGTGPEWPSVQVHATAKMVAALCKRYGVPVSRVLGHKEICYPVGRKVDPVGIPGDMPAFRALVQQYINEEDVVNEYQERVLVETQRRVTLMREELAQLRAVADALKAALDRSYAVDVENQRRITAANTAVQALAELVAQGTDGLTADEVKAAVQEAIEAGVVKVDVSVAGQVPQV